MGAVLSVPESPALVAGDCVKPPRLNFAGICLHCGERGCVALGCVAWHAESCWMVCPECGGEEWTETLQPCWCMFGVIEA